MITKLVENFIDLLIEKNITKFEDREIIIYGLTNALSIVFNIITTILLGVIYDLFLESVIFLISFSCIRSYAGGYHCENPIMCYILSSFIVILTLSVIKFIPDNYIFLLSICIVLISSIVILIFAPVETLTKPLDNIEKRYFRKKTIQNLSISILIIIILFIFKINNISFTISLSIMMSAVFIIMQKLSNKK